MPIVGTHPISLYLGTSGFKLCNSFIHTITSNLLVYINWVVSRLYYNAFMLEYLMFFSPVQIRRVCQRIRNYYFFIRAPFWGQVLAVPLGVLVVVLAD